MAAESTHEPPSVAIDVISWHGGDEVHYEPLSEHHAARDSRCGRESEPVWERDAPRYTFARSHRNLETRLDELDARLDRDLKARPKQLSADEVAGKVRAAGKLAEDVLRRDPVLAAAICVHAFVLWGQTPSNPQTLERKGAKARFSGAAAALRAATTRTAVLGLSGASYGVAESKGRTVARWGEIDCKPSHSGGSRPRALSAVERELDAVVGVTRASIDPMDLEGLRIWLVDAPQVETPKGTRLDWATVLRRYRCRLAGMATDASGPLDAATASWTDKALRERLRRAKRHLEGRFRSIPEAAAELAGRVSASDREELGLLRGLIPEATSRERPVKPRRERLIPGLRSEVTA